MTAYYQHVSCSLQAKTRPKRFAAKRTRCVLEFLPMEDYKKISGERLRKAREDLGLSLPEVCARVGHGLKASTLGNWEQGTRYPNDIEVFDALSKVLGEPASYLAAIDRDEEVTVLVRRFYKMDRRGKDTITAIAESQPQYNTHNS